MVSISLSVGCFRGMIGPVVAVNQTRCKNAIMSKAKNKTEEIPECRSLKACGVCC